MKKRRVLLMAFQLGIGGSERQLTEVAKALDRNFFEPYVGCFHEQGVRAEELREAGVPIIVFGVRSFFSPRALGEGMRLARFLRSEKIDIVHAFDVPMNVFAVPFAKFAGTPVVLSSQRAHRDLTSRLYRHVLRFTDQIVDGIVVNCDYMRRHLIEDEHVPEDRIHLCYNGMDLARFHSRERSTEADITTIGVVCALRPEKDLPTLVRAFADLVVNKAASLHIVGSGPEEDALKALARELGIEQLTTFIPSQSNVSGYLRAMDIFVLPSKSEALSNALMEAMACGCACVASNVGGKSGTGG